VLLAQGLSASEADFFLQDHFAVAPSGRRVLSERFRPGNFMADRSAPLAGVGLGSPLVKTPLYGRRLDDIQGHGPLEVNTSFIQLSDNGAIEVNATMSTNEDLLSLEEYYDAYLRGARLACSVGTAQTTGKGRRQLKERNPRVDEYLELVSRQQPDIQRRMAAAEEVRLRIDLPSSTAGADAKGFFRLVSRLGGILHFSPWLLQTLRGSDHTAECAALLANQAWEQSGSFLELVGASASVASAASQWQSVELVLAPVHSGTALADLSTSWAFHHDIESFLVTRGIQFSVETISLPPGMLPAYPASGSASPGSAAKGVLPRSNHLIKKVVINQDEATKRNIRTDTMTPYIGPQQNRKLTSARQFDGEHATRSVLSWDKMEAGWDSSCKCYYVSFRPFADRAVGLNFEDVDDVTGRPIAAKRELKPIEDSDVIVCKDCAAGFYFEFRGDLRICISQWQQTECGLNSQFLDLVRVYASGGAGIGYELQINPGAATGTSPRINIVPTSALGTISVLILLLPVTVDITSALDVQPYMTIRSNVYFRQGMWWTVQAKLGAQLNRGSFSLINEFKGSSGEIPTELRINALPAMSVSGGIKFIPVFGFLLMKLLPFELETALDVDLLTVQARRRDLVDTASLEALTETDSRQLIASGCGSGLSYRVDIGYGFSGAVGDSNVSPASNWYTKQQEKTTPLIPSGPLCSTCTGCASAPGSSIISPSRTPSPVNKGSASPTASRSRSRLIGNSKQPSPSPTPAAPSRTASPSRIVSKTASQSRAGASPTATPSRSAVRNQASKTRSPSLSSSKTVTKTRSATRRRAK
jgi:hypothetical protein